MIAVAWITPFTAEIEARVVEAKMEGGGGKDGKNSLIISVKATLKNRVTLC